MAVVNSALAIAIVTIMAKIAIMAKMAILAVLAMAIGVTNMAILGI